MSQDLTLNVSDVAVVILTDTVGNPVTGLTFSDVTCLYKKSGALSFTAKTLTALNFIEISNGIYNITFTATELNTAGDFTVVVTGASIRQFTNVYNVVAATSSTSAPSILTCTLTGHIVDATGTPVQGAAVMARPLGMPSIQTSGVDSYGFTDSTVAAVTDVNGQFFITLPQLLTVQVTIPTINYLRSLTVPASSSANLFSDVP